MTFKMSNFSSSFTGGSWSRRPSGDSQRRSGKSLPQAPGHRHHTAGGGGADGGGGRRQATGQWGRRQFNGGGTKCAAGVEPAQTEPTTTNIKDLYPHQPNTVRQSTCSLTVCAVSLVVYLVLDQFSTSLIW